MRFKINLEDKTTVVTRLAFTFKRKKRRCRGSNPGHPRDRREYLPLYYNDSVVIFNNQTNTSNK